MRIDNPSISGSLSFIGGTNSISATSVSLTGSLSGTFEGAFSGDSLTNISGAFNSVSESLASDISANASSITSLNAATSSYLLNTTDTLDGDLTVTGKITAQEFHTEFVSASIIYQSGSTQFGNSADDTHIFTGTGSFDRVGIGTDSPLYNLVISNAGAEGIELGPGYLSGANLWQNYNRSTSQYVKEVHFASEYQLLSGNVGIGSESPSTRLNLKEANTGTEGFIVTNWNNVNTVLLGSDNTTGGGKLSLKTNGGTTNVFISAYTDSYFNGGNVGINATNPDAKLRIDASDNNQLKLNRTGVGAYKLFVESGGGFVFEDDGTETLRIDASGRVGIGTTPDGLWSTSYDALQIGLGGSIYAHSSAGNAMKIGSNIVYEGTAPNYYDKYLSNSTATKYEQDAGNHIWSVAGAGTVFDPVSWTEAMRINNSGNVGIGVNNPSRTLHVVGRQMIDGLGLTFQRTGVLGGQNWDIGIDASGLYIFDNTNVDYRLVINPLGNIGIGVSNATAKLHVGGTLFAGVSTFNSTFQNAYTNDGLYNANAFPSKVLTPSGQQIIFGYFDNGAGGYFPRIGLRQDYDAVGSPNTTTAHTSLGLEQDGRMSFKVGASNSIETLTLNPNGRVFVNRTDGDKLFMVRTGTTASGVHYVAGFGGNSPSLGYAVGIGLDPEGYSGRHKIGIVAEGTNSGWSSGKLHFLVRKDIGVNGEADLSHSRMTIDEDGRVSVGTTSTDAKFHVDGSVVKHTHLASDLSTHSIKRFYSAQSAFNDPQITIISSATATSSYPQITVHAKLMGRGVSANRVQYTEVLATMTVNGSTIEGLTQTVISHTYLNSASTAGSFSVSGGSLFFTPHRQTNYDGYSIEVRINSKDCTYNF